MLRLILVCYYSVKRIIGDFDKHSKLLGWEKIDSELIVIDAGSTSNIGIDILYSV